MTDTSTAQRVGLPALPALVVGQVHHARPRPTAYAFTHRHYQWLVDLDDVPTGPRWLRPVRSFRAEDHLSGPADFARLRSEVLALLDDEGLESGRVTRVVMLAHARILGHAFDPMSAFWCLEGDRVVGVVIEVHNTYGGRHAYVVRPDAGGRASVDKTFYVSPFNAVEGEYDISLHLSPERVAVAIRLDVDNERLMTASVVGRCRPATTGATLRAALRMPAMTHRVSALIRFHGIRLWARRLPVIPRPAPDAGSLR